MPLGGRPGLARTRVIPAEWETHHRPVSEDGMQAECRIERPATSPVWDDVAGRDVFPAPALVYEGMCRFHGTAPSSSAPVADKDMPRGQYTVTIPTDSDEILKNDVVRLTACDGDPAAVGKTLQVMGATRSAKTWERTLTVQMPQPTTNQA
ncbi:DUF6093 family protein [Phytohabitans houttuyneae]|uniref:Uncharacterized protein n=1 Tax=Phytohabitans houttuyneae TaxID=1076126 RepID=A0A6V8K2W5_9ACTN|nr:DUF6093 family protein [Phytohabitans houttuyneae]GFJ79482.1 hypothetical protein Phou_036620 [Phytohabitans houttuyneae]